jgi:glutathione synthase/RimK-type ligase-like ATP-grasp enzyme
MNDNLKCLTECCRRLDIDFTILHDSGNLVEVRLVGNAAIFANWATPLNPHSLARLCMDKEYAYRYFRRWARMPHTVGFLDPRISAEYRGYLRQPNRETILTAIEATFTYPVMVKRNSGSRGEHVYRCESKLHASKALQEIFRQGRKGYDYVAIAQECVSVGQEYRVVTYRKEIAFAYQKTAGKPGSEGNISPLHTNGGQADLIGDRDLLDSLAGFLQPLHENSLLMYGGLDVIRDRDGAWWLLEVNSAPSFTYFIRDNGNERVLELYERILNDMAGGVSFY